MLDVLDHGAGGARDCAAGGARDCAAGGAPPLDQAPIFPLEAFGLAYAAEGRPLLGPLDLRLEAGGITAIVGPNGAGKSLLLRLLHGLLPPSAGRVAWNGRPADAGVKRRSAMVFQHPVLLRRSARANLLHALRHGGVARTERQTRTTEALEAARLLHRADVSARILSGGEQQRLALARALCLDPAILFLDEPTSSLDPHATALIEARLEAAREAGVTVVLVTHDLGQARRLADTVAVMHQGRIVERASAAAFFAGPKSAEARAFVRRDLVL